MDSGFVHRIPLWMRLLGSVWTGRLALLASCAALYLVAADAPPADLGSWAKVVGLCFGPTVLIVPLLSFLIGRGDLRCPSCRKLTQSSPRPPMVGGMSEPHLRCDRCGTILWGL